MEGPVPEGLRLDSDGTLSWESPASGTHEVDVVVTGGGSASLPTTIRLSEHAEPLAPDAAADRSEQGVSRWAGARVGMGALLVAIVVAVVALRRRSEGRPPAAPHGS